jgi:DNA-binding transcriptional regulator PaaX
MEDIAMNHIVYTDVARKCGIRAALVCAYLWQQHTKLESSKSWLRISQKSMTVAMPFLSERTIRRAVKELDESGVLRRKEKNDSAYDRTHSYRFTDYGRNLMIGAVASLLSESYMERE